MNGKSLMGALLKSLLTVSCIFLVGYFGYHYPDAMIVAISVAIFIVFSWYFYTKDKEA